MKRILCFLALPVCLLLTTGLTVPGNHTSTVRHDKHKDCEVVTTAANTVEKNYKKILITSFGEIAIRHFVETLSLQLTNHCSKTQIICVYEHIGKQPETAEAGLQAAVKKHQPDAILSISSYHDAMGALFKKRDQFNTALTDDQRIRQRVLKPGKVKLDLELQATLWEQQTDQPIWKGDMLASGKADSHAFFERMSGLLTDELEKNKILPVLP